MLSQKRFQHFKRHFENVLFHSVVLHPTIFTLRTHHVRTSCSFWWGLTRHIACESGSGWLQARKNIKVAFQKVRHKMNWNQWLITQTKGAFTQERMKVCLVTANVFFKKLWVIPVFYSYVSSFDDGVLAAQWTTQQNHVAVNDHWSRRGRGRGRGKDEQMEESLNITLHAESHEK